MTEEKRNNQTRIVDYELKEDFPVKRPERINLNRMENETIIITDISFRSSKRYNNYVVVTDTEGQEYYTFSKLALKQAREITEILNTGALVAVKVMINNNRQVYFTTPNKAEKNNKKKK